MAFINQLEPAGRSVLSEVVQSQVLEVKMFHSPYGTGVAIVTGSLCFTLATNIDDLSTCYLKSQEGEAFLLGRPHSGWTD